MGRYKTDIIHYESKEWPTEDLIFFGFTCARRHSEVTIEIAAHLFDAAFINYDVELFKAGRELMHAGGSPCSFTPNDSAEQAMSNNNRPSVPEAPTIPKYLLNGCDESEEGWDSSRDSIFDEKIKPLIIKRAIDGVKSEKIKKKPYFFVAFTILKILKYIPLNTSPREFLLWVNLHFKCGWPEDPKTKKLYFNLDGTLQKLSKMHPSEWKDAKDDEGRDFWGKVNLEYYKLAISFKNAFTMTMFDGKPVDDSESFEHLRDRVEFLSGARDYYGMLYAPDKEYINLG